MALVVQKYGGTSVGDIEKIRNVARRVANVITSYSIHYTKLYEDVTVTVHEKSPKGRSAR